MSDCPTCPKSFDTERGVKIHHSQAHNVSLNEFYDDREWINTEMTEVPADEVDLDRMLKHLNDTLKLTQEKFDLDAGPT